MTLTTPDRIALGFVAFSLVAFGLLGMASIYHANREYKRMQADAKKRFDDMISAGETDPRKLYECDWNRR